MAIGRLYYFTLSILALGFCCITNYHMWPEKGYLPHQNVGNKFRKDPEEQKKEAEREAKRKAERKKQKKEHKKKRDIAKGRRDPDPVSGDDSEPEWLKFNPNHLPRYQPQQHVPLSTHHPGARNGPAKEVSFGGRQPRSNFATQQDGPVSDGYTSHDYIYGKGGVRTDEPTRVFGVRSPPRARRHGQHNGSAESPDSRAWQPVHSPTASNRSRHATVQSDSLSPQSAKPGTLTPGTRAFSTNM